VEFLCGGHRVHEGAKEDELGAGRRPEGEPQGGRHILQAPLNGRADPAKANVRPFDLKFHLPGELRAERALNSSTTE
jgi:hypothetical protein